LAIEASMDYCETCGKFTAGDDSCVACGWIEVEPVDESGDRGGDGTAREVRAAEVTAPARDPENRSGNPA
jgi:hypothetical protein